MSKHIPDFAEREAIEQGRWSETVEPECEGPIHRVPHFKNTCHCGELKLPGDFLR